MASQMETGREGEKLAEAWLAANGYTVLHRNWRHGRYEIDLVCTKENKLRFIEVKLRQSNEHGHPEMAVTKKKYYDLMQAVNQYMLLNATHADFRLDVMAITRHSPAEIDYYLIEDVCL